jgi:hypothetical protein
MRLLRKRWRREPPPAEGDVRVCTCVKCGHGVWNSQLKRWCGAARFVWYRTGLCQECQGYGPVSEEEKASE